MAAFDVPTIFSRIDELAPQYGMDPSVAKSIILAENTKEGRIRSGTFSGDATNVNKTMGIGQVIPSTARGLQQAGYLPPEWKFDPNNLDSQLHASLAAMKEMKGRQKNPNDAFELGAMYNGGNATWQAYQQGKPLNPESTQYLQKMRNGMEDLQMTPQQIEAMAARKPGSVMPDGSLVRAPGSSTSSRSSTRSSTALYDPASLEAFQKQIGVLTGPGGTIDQGIAALGDRGGEVAASGDLLMQSIMQAGQAAGAAASSEAMVKASAAITRKSILDQANLNPSATNNRAAEALRALDETSTRLDQLKPAIDEKMAVGFFDNPLMWAINQTRLPGMVGEYNAIVGTQKDQLQKYDAAASIASKQISMSDAIDADAIMQAGATAAQAKASSAVATARNVQFAMANKSAADALQAVNLETQRAAALGQLNALSKQQVVESAGETEAQGRVKAEAAALTDFNTLITAAGGQAIPMDKWKSLSSKAKTDILQRNATTKFGDNFVEAMQFVNDYGNLDVIGSKGQLPVRVWVDASRQTASGMVQAAQVKAEAMQDKKFNPEKEMKESLLAIAAQYQAASAVNMRGAKEANPFAIAYKTINKSPELAANSWAQRMNKFGPEGSERIYQDFDEQQFLNKAITEIKLAPDDVNKAALIKQNAADIAQYYQFASRRQQETTKPQMWGLRTPPKTYAVQLPQYKTAGGKNNATVDLGNATEVENLMTRKLAMETMLDSMAGGQQGFTGQVAFGAGT